MIGWGSLIGVGSCMKDPLRCIGKRNSNANLTDYFLAFVGYVLIYQMWLKISISQVLNEFAAMKAL